MNYCIIQGRKVYPTLGTNIKITKENPLIKDRDAQTMEIEFPLAIDENRRMFGSVNRIDVAKRAVQFDDCALYAGNIMVIKGRGFVTTFNEKAVKLQIVSGLRTTEYNDSWDKIFIDRIDLWPDFMGAESPVMFPNFGEGWAFELPAVYDETNDEVLNNQYFLSTDYNVWNGPFYKNTCIQPYLAFVLRRVLLYVGYTLSSCFLDNEPWSRILIYNNRYALVFQKALPHWSVKTFLTEFKKLFNVSFIFDENDKTVSLQRLEDAQEMVAYECLDEFSTDYDEDGLEYIGASNLAYNLSDSIENKYADISEDVLNKFTLREYTTLKEASAAAEAMNEKEMMTSVFYLTGADEKDKWYYAKTYDFDSGTRRDLTPFAWYMHLRREKGSDNTVQLNMVPCADQHVEFKVGFKYDNKILHLEHESPVAFSMPSSTNGSETSDALDYKEYVSVEDYIENGDEPVEQEEAERMELYFINGIREVETDKYDKTVHFKSAGSWYSKGSFRFEGGLGSENIGQFHKQVKTIENREQIVIKFLSDTMPDPKKTFIFRNKRFLCDKVELQLTDTGIDRLMTGYFYEMS